MSSITSWLCIILTFMTFSTALAKKAAEEGVPAPPVISEAESYDYTNHYVHQWLDFPSILGQWKGKDIELKATDGKVQVVFFLASWCIACQKLVKRFKLLEEKYKSKEVGFVYVFLHDLREDAERFSSPNVYDLKSTIIGNKVTGNHFHNPELPAVYLSDKHKWLLKRYLKPKLADFAHLDGLLQKLTLL